MKSQSLTHLKLRARPASFPLGLALDSFYLDAEARRLTPKTLRYYKQQLGPFLEAVKGQGIREPEGITANHIRSYLVSLEKRGLSSASQHSSARAIRAFCNFLVREELLGKSPMQKVRMPKQEKKIMPAFAPEDVQKILKACKYKRDTAITLFLLDTGCRSSEFVALNVGDVDIKTGAVKIKHGKGRKHRVAFVGAKARKALLKHFMERGDTEPNEALWLSMNTGERLTDYGLRQLFQRLGKRAGVKHCHPHTFRRSFALWSLRAGMNIYALQQIMGHSDLAILRRYLALVEEDLKEAHKKYGAVDNML